MTDYRVEGVQEGIPRAYSMAIIGLLIAFVALGVLTFYKWVVREPSITPEEVNIKVSQQLVAQQPKNVNYIVALGYAFQRDGKLAQAKEQYLKALKLDPKNMGCLYNLGIFAQSEKKYVEAENYYMKVLGVDSKHFLTTLGLAEVYLASKQYDKAITYADKLIKVQKQTIDPHLIKAQALEQTGKKAAAKAEYQVVLKFVPQQPDAQKALERLK